MTRTFLLMALMALMSALAAPVSAQTFVAAPGATPGTLPAVPTTGRAPGLYVQVIDGQINLANPAGSLNFSAGQFGYTANYTQPPVMVPTNPGIQFTPPPVFNSSTVSAATGTTNAGAVDCIVR